MKIYEILEARGPKPIPIDPAVAKNIVDLYSQGMYFKDVAAKTGINVTKVFRYLKGLPNWEEIQSLHNKNLVVVPGRGFSRGITSDTVSDIAKRYAQGDSALKIEAELGISDTTILYHLRKLPNWKELRAANIQNGTRVGPKNITRDQIEQMAKLYANGSNPVDIGKDFGVTGPTVLYHLERHLKWPKILAAHYAQRRALLKK